MEQHPLPAAPSDMNAKYEKAIREKLEALMRTRHYSQTQFCEMLKDRGLALEQGNLSSMLKGRKRIPLSLIVQICNIFQITLAELVDENFGGARQVGGTSPVHQVYSDDLLQLVPYLGSNFVIDPSDDHFAGYLQRYYVYLLPSQGDNARLRTGTLVLQAKDSVCEAVLEINTNKIRDGKPYTRTYRGRCIISRTMRAVYILLTDSGKGELSVVNFRYFNRVDHPLDCRIACTLLNATGEEHPPTVQRMFLSRTQIAEEDIPLLLPHLYLNSGIVRVQKEQLESLCRNDSIFREPIEELLFTNPSRTFYCLEEDDILSAARHYLDKADVNRFLSQLRSLAEIDHIHKASRRADLLSHKLLRSLGYYHDYDN